MADLLVDIIDYIIAGGLATAKDVDIFRDYSPSSPDACVVLYEYQGTEPAPFTDMSVRSVQATARDKDVAAARAKCTALYKLLHDENLLTQIGTRKCLIQMRNTPIKIGVDLSQRTIYGFNMGITTNND